MNFEVYSDGSATTADKPGGFAFVIVRDGVKLSEGSGHLPKATNNVAEITAAIRGLETLLNSAEYAAACVSHPNGANVVLVSDSQLVLNYANGGYQCRKPHLLPLYIALRKNYQLAKATTRWVRGHTGDEHNERCDVLAGVARCQQPAHKDNQVSANPAESIEEPGNTT